MSKDRYMLRLTLRLWLLLLLLFVVVAVVSVLLALSFSLNNNKIYFKIMLLFNNEINVKSGDITIQEKQSKVIG